MLMQWFSRKTINILLASGAFIFGMNFLFRNFRFPIKPYLDSTPYNRSESIDQQHKDKQRNVYLKDDDPIASEVTINKSAFIFELSTERINKLFEILHEKEKKFEGALRKLDVLMFENLVEGKSDVALKELACDEKKFLKIGENKRVQVTNEFINYLYNLSYVHSIIKPRRQIKKFKLPENEEKPVILIAANSDYYDPLKRAIKHVKDNLPDYDKLIVYDLGLSKEMFDTIVNLCNCTVLKFDFDYYSKISGHILHLKTYAWKPIIIQETLKTHANIIYIDSAVCLLTNEIGSQLNALKDIGFYAEYLTIYNQNLTCYTAPLMFEWFGKNANDFEDVFTVWANQMFFSRERFVTPLLMKAWVTCALDNECIAPPGSRLEDCCGCHRYDQDAITIITTFFYGYPRDSKNLMPAYSTTLNERYFFKIIRG